METKGSDSGVSRLLGLDALQWKHRGVQVTRVGRAFTSLHLEAHPTISIGVLPPVRFDIPSTEFQPIATAGRPQSISTQTWLPRTDSSTYVTVPYFEGLLWSGRRGKAGVGEVLTVEQ